LGLGNGGLGIEDCAQSPFPNPKYPIPNPQSNPKKEKKVNYLT